MKHSLVANLELIIFKFGSFGGNANDTNKAEEEEEEEEEEEVEPTKNYEQLL